MIKRYKAVEDTLKELEIKEKDKSFLRIFGELVLDKQREIILEEMIND